MLQSQDILKREEEFLKLNAEIDLQTKSLLQEVAYLKEFNADRSELSIEPRKYVETNNIQKEMGEKLPASSPENKFDLTEYFDKIKMATSSRKEIESSESGGATTIQEEVLAGKNGRLKGRVSLSAKLPVCTLSTTNLEHQAVFPLETVRHKSETELKSGKLDGDFNLETMRGIGQEGMIRFLTAKVKLLSDQVQAMQKKKKKLLDNIKELQSQKDKATEEKDRLTQQVNSAKNLLVKCEQNTQSLVAQLQTSQTENSHLKKEVEGLKRDMRLNKQNYNATELKLNRTAEELEKLKHTLQQMKHEEKELKESSRRKIEDLTAAIKKADKQRLELINGFKKQLTIIDNFKRQKGLIEAAKLLKSSEDDFIYFLDCNPPQ